MRVAIFAETFLPKFDGITNTLCYLLEHLATRRHTTLMFAPQDSPARYAATPIIGLPSIRFPLYPELKLVPPSVNIGETLAAFRPDIVHVVSPVTLGLAGLRQARALGLPVVASYHTDIPGYATRYGLSLLRQPLWRYFRWLHNQADLTLCPSRYTRDELAEHRFRRLRIWGRGVDAARFAPARRSGEWRARLSGGAPDAPLLLYVGRLASEKRIDWLRPVLQALPGARLAVVGDGPLRPALAELFAGLPVVFTGYLRGDDLAAAYASADAFVFPSDRETFGNVVLEAMASGLPILVPRAGGPVDHVQDERNGLFFAADSQQDLVDQARRLVLDGELRQRLGAAARRHAESQTWPAIFDELLSDYARVMADYGRASTAPVQSPIARGGQPVHRQARQTQPGLRS